MRRSVGRLMKLMESMEINLMMIHLPSVMHQRIATNYLNLIQIINIEKCSNLRCLCSHTF